MIFKLDGTIENTLALTPVIFGWKEMTDEKVFLNVLYPELFDRNPYVDGIVTKSMPNEGLLDFNQISWQSVQKPVCETFMHFVFGKHRPTCWRTLMYHTEEDAKKAEAFVPDKAVVVAMKNIPEGLMESLTREGYLVTKLTHQDCKSFHVFRAAVSRASLYIGDDGDDTAIAMTTDVPAVVCYTWRNPVYFTPFRRGIPFEVVSPRKEDCLYSDGCLSNGLFEFGKTYQIRCYYDVPNTMKEKMVCQRNATLQRIMQAVEKIRAKVCRH